MSGLAWGDLGQVLTFVGVPEEHWKAFEETVGDYFKQKEDNSLETAITMLKEVEQTTEETRSTKNNNNRGDPDANRKRTCLGAPRNIQS